MKRIARIGDGWMPQMPPNERARELVDQLRADVRAAGRAEDASRRVWVLARSATRQDGSPLRAAGATWGRRTSTSTQWAPTIPTSASTWMRCAGRRSPSRRSAKRLSE
jgi:alkanesulfonate monooxygenase SsuD/methylene tetrahydromethanopterin reductase-like flavin-dependent oxidoreductase (luciferase family)